MGIGRSQRHLREIQGIDSGGNTDNPTGPQPGVPYIDVTPASLLLAGSTPQDFTVTLTLDGAPIVGATLTAVPDNAGVAGAAVSGVSDASGIVTVTMTGVAVGSTFVTLATAGALDKTPPVTAQAALVLASLGPTPINTAHPGGGSVAISLEDGFGNSLDGETVTAVINTPGVVTLDPSAVVTTGSASFTYATVAAGSTDTTYSYPGAADVVVQFVVT